MTAFPVRSRKVTFHPGLSAAILFLFAGIATVHPLNAATLKPETLAAFEHYVALTDARNAAELQRGTALLWIDALPDALRREAYAALRSGAVQTKRLQTLDGGAAIDCPGGMIHHWAGLVFIPGAKLGDVLGVLQDYDRHAQDYAPDVTRSKLESREGNRFRFYLRFRRHQIITVVLDTQHEVQYLEDSPVQAHSRSSALRITQVREAGTAREYNDPPGDDDGFLWKMETWWRMIERDGGVYVQGEVVSLTRSIPAGLGWLIGPFVTKVPKESLEFTMQATRRAVLRKLTNSGG
jgi:hypothetical protein